MKKWILYLFSCILFLSFFTLASRQSYAQQYPQCTQIYPFSPNPATGTVKKGELVEAVALAQYLAGLCSGPFTWSWQNLPMELSPTIMGACTSAPQYCTPGDTNTDDSVMFKGTFNNVGTYSWNVTIQLPNGQQQTGTFVINVIENPNLFCNSACSLDADCAGARDGCVACVGGVCKPPPACNVACSRDADCAGARDGCNACVGGSCQQPPACNVACSRDADCAGARDGCNACVGGTCKAPTTPTVPPPACNVACSRDADCAGARDGCNACIGGTCKQPPACNSSCSRDSDCAGARDGCTSCQSGVCKPSTTPTTVPPACNLACSRDADCAGARDGCNACIGGSCQQPPACNSSCSRDSDCAGARDGCTSCNNGKCSSDFSQNMCKCDGIEYVGTLAPGEEVTATNFEKVEGSDISKAKVKDMTFYFTKGNQIIEKSSPIPAQVASSSNNKVRYKASWKVKLPSDIDQNVEYRIFAQTNCVKKDVAINYNSTSERVLGTAAEESGANIFQRIAEFFRRIFGGNQTNSEVPASRRPSPTPPQGTKPIQIGSFNPATVLEQSCRFIKFKF